MPENDKYFLETEMFFDKGLEICSTALKNEVDDFF